MMRDIAPHGNRRKERALGQAAKDIVRVTDEKRPPSSLWWWDRAWPERRRGGPGGGCRPRPRVRTGALGRSPQRSRSERRLCIGGARGGSRTGWRPPGPAPRPPEATHTRRRAGSPSGGQRVPPGAGGTRVRDPAPAGREARRTREGGGQRAGQRAAHAQKHARQPGLQEPGGRPPEATAAFVGARADPLEGSQRPEDAHRPRGCCEEGTPPGVTDVRTPRPGAPGHRERLDDEDARHGTGHRGRRGAPLAGQREGLGPARRPAVAAAAALQPLGDGRSPRAEPLGRVQDTRPPHPLASLSEAFPPEAARRLIDPLAGHATPQPGRGLHRAAIARGGLRRQGLDRRIPDLATWTDEVAAWQRDRNAGQVTVTGPGTTTDARVKLQRLSPMLEPVKNKWTDH
jgi:hypothetical protein